MAVGGKHSEEKGWPLGRKGSRVAAANQTTLDEQALYQVDLRFDQGCGKPLDAGSAGQIGVEILGEGLCPSMGLERLI